MIIPLGLTNSNLAGTRETILGEFSFSGSVSSYFTIGDILPSGLSQAAWQDTFLGFSHSGSINGGEHTYRDYPSGQSPFGHQMPPADFVYGQPDREFDNRIDLVDPATLDWATAALLTYNPLSGEVLIDTTVDGGGYISFLLLESDGGLIPENFNPWVNTPFTAAREDLIGFAADLIEPGVYSAGQILPPGLSLGEVNDTLTRASFIGRFGFGGSLDFDIDADSIDFDIALLSFSPGDFNQDGAVDLLDLEILGRNFGQPGGPSEGDANGEGSVDLLDLDAFGDPSFGVPVPVAIPEPAAMALLAAAVLGLFAHRRR